MFAGITMGQENVLCLEYGLLRNVDRRCDFHRIMALQRCAMSVINAMNNASQYTKLRKNGYPRFQVLAAAGGVVKLLLVELTLRNTGTSPSNDTLNSSSPLNGNENSRE